MSCIEISLRRVGTPLSFMAARMGDSLNFTAERKGKPLEFRCGLVCSVSEAFYLNVEPELIWLLPENGFSQDVAVYSNVHWTIE